jgi:hypothetical protein
MMDTQGQGVNQKIMSRPISLGRGGGDGGRKKDKKKGRIRKRPERKKEASVSMRANSSLVRS